MPNLGKIYPCRIYQAATTIKSHTISCMINSSVSYQTFGIKPVHSIPVPDFPDQALSLIEPPGIEGLQFSPYAMNNRIEAISKYGFRSRMQARTVFESRHRRDILVLCRWFEIWTQHPDWTKRLHI